jgi:hypothetical protein
MVSPASDMTAHVARNADSVAQQSQYQRLSTAPSGGKPS